jgi:hypothetical protein
MTFSTCRILRPVSKVAAISAVQLICAMPLLAQDRVNPQAQVMAEFTKRVKAYLSLQKRVEGGLPAQKETKDTERIKTHVTSLAEGIRAARAGARPGDVFGSAAEQFRAIVKADSKERSGRDKSAAMQEVPKRTPPRVNADYPEAAALATVPPLILTRLPRLPDGLEYRFMGRDLILRDTKANLIVDLIPGAVPDTAAR